MGEPQQQASKDTNSIETTTTKTTTSTNEVVSLEGWSTRVEDLLDKDDEDGAVTLLEAVIAKLSVAPNAASNLALAVAMSDLGALYGSRGLSLKADQLLSDALLIKQKAEAGATPEADHLSWEDAAEETTTSSKVGVKALKKPGALQERVTDYTWTPSTTTTSMCDEEATDWEAAVPALLASPPVAKQKPETVKEKVKEVPKQKQRGRGAFTYGGGGNLYSDMTPEDGATGGRVDQASSTGTANDHWDGGAEHVLLIDGFSPMSKTKDLEDLLRPYSGQGVSIRWIDDTTAAAVFRTPVLARQALAGIRDPRFKLHKYTEAGANLSGQLISLSVTDLEPPAPRPATTARVAQRMIAGALSRQGVNSQSLHAKTRANAGQMLQQEAERKQRLLSRQQMRDDAWGKD